MSPLRKDCLSTLPHSLSVTKPCFIFFITVITTWHYLICLGLFSLSPTFPLKAPRVQEALSINSPLRTQHTAQGLTHNRHSVNTWKNEWLCVLIFHLSVLFLLNRKHQNPSHWLYSEFAETKPQNSPFPPPPKHKSNWVTDDDTNFAVGIIIGACHHGPHGVVDQGQDIHIYILLEHKPQRASVGGTKVLPLYLSPHRKQKQWRWLVETITTSHLLGLLGRCKASVKVQGSSGKKEQLGAKEGNPCSCFMVQGLCAMEIWEMAHRDASPCLKDPEEKMFILGAMVIPGENTKALTSGDTLVSARSNLWAAPWVSRLGFPFCQVDLGYFTMVPQGLGEYFKVKWKQ